MPKSPPLTPGQPDLYLGWLRTTRPATGTEKDAEDLMAYVVNTWQPEPKVPDGEQVKFFTKLDSRAAALPPAHLPYFWDNVSHLFDNWYATGAYRRARAAEARHGLPVDAEYLVANALFLTRRAGLRGTEQATHLRWLGQAFDPDRAHRELARFVADSATHNYLEPPEELAELVRASADAAGLGLAEDSRVLGTMLSGECAWRAPEQLLQDIAKVFAEAQPDDAVQRQLLKLFTRSQRKTNGKGLLQALKNSGAFDAMVTGRLVPDGGCGAWLTNFVDHYTYYWTPRVTLRSQPMPNELYGLLPKLAPPIKAAGEAVRVHYAVQSRTLLDARLADTCLQLGIPIQDPGAGITLTVPPRRTDAYAHLRADPVLGPRVAHLDLRPGSGGQLR